MSQCMTIKAIQVRCWFLGLKNINQYSVAFGRTSIQDFSVYSNTDFKGKLKTIDRIGSH